MSAVELSSEARPTLRELLVALASVAWGTVVGRIIAAVSASALLLASYVGREDVAFVAALDSFGALLFARYPLWAVLYLIVWSVDAISAAFSGEPVPYATLLNVVTIACLALVLTLGLTVVRTLFLRLLGLMVCAALAFVLFVLASPAFSVVSVPLAAVTLGDIGVAIFVGLLLTAVTVPLSQVGLTALFKPLGTDPSTTMFGRLERIAYERRGRTEDTRTDPGPPSSMGTALGVRDGARVGSPPA